MTRLWIGVALTLLVGSLLPGCRRADRWNAEWEAWFEESQPSEAIMDTLGIAPGMVLAEVGAGSGRLAVKMARRVGAQGHVYANDIDPTALEFMRRRVKKQSIHNMTVVGGRVADPRLPAGALDLVYLVNTYEHLAKPVPLMTRIIPALKPEGVLVIIAADPEKTGDRQELVVPRKKVVDEAEAAGFELVRVSTFLRDDTIYFFRPRPLDR